MGDQGSGFTRDGKRSAKGDETDKIYYASKNDQSHYDMEEHEVLSWWKREPLWQAVWHEKNKDREARNQEGKTNFKKTFCNADNSVPSGVRSYVPNINGSFDDPGHQFDAPKKPYITNTV